MTLTPSERDEGYNQAVIESLAERAKMIAAIIACQRTLTNVCQIIDVVKIEWSAENAWSEWDQSVRDDITACLSALYKITGDRAALQKADTR